MRTAERQSGNRVGALLAGLLLTACGTADPVAQPALLQIAEGGEVSGTLRVSGTAGHRVTFGLVSPPAHGALRLDVDTGSFVYRAERYYNGEDRFSFTASAGGQTSAPATVTLQVAAVNDRPAAQGVAPEAAVGGSVMPNGVVELLEDGAFSGRLQALDPDMQVLTFQVDAAPTGGTLELDPATGDFTYRPIAHWSGVDRFTYSATDGGLTSEPATVTLVVAPVNDAPTGQAQSYTGDEDAVLTGRLAASDLDSTVLTYSVASPPVHGSVVLDPATGAFRYQPQPEFSGADSFAFTASDGLATSNPVTVSITVVPVNDAPVASGQAIALDEDGAFAGQVAASDVDGPVLVYAIETPPAHGTLDLDPGTGAFVYRPATDFFGPDAFSFTATDGLLASAAAAVTIAVLPVNDAPVALGQAVALDEDTVLSGQLLATDVDGPGLAFAAVSQPAHGTLELDGATGTFVYRPSADYFGTDQFAFTVTDGLATSMQATVVVAVAPVNDAPVATDESLAGAEDTSIGGMVRAHDVDGDSLSFTIVAAPRSGAVTIDAATGAFEYSPLSDYFGQDEFGVGVRDDAGASTVATIALTVRPVPTVPVVTAPRVLAQTSRAHLAWAAPVEGDSVSWSVSNAVLTLPPVGDRVAFVVEGGATSVTLTAVSERGGVTSAPRVTVLPVIAAAPTPAEVSLSLAAVPPQSIGSVPVDEGSADRWLAVANLSEDPLLNPQLYPPGSPLGYRMEDINESIGPQDGERLLAEAAWRYVTDRFFHFCSGGAPGVDPYYSAYSPHQALVGIGFGCCDQTARYLAALWAQLGLASRVAYMPFHSVAEVQYGGEWHMYDPDHRTFYYKRDGATVASVAETLADPELVVLSADSSGRDPVGWSAATMAALYAANASGLWYAAPLHAPEADLSLAPGESFTLNERNQAGQVVHYQYSWQGALDPSRVTSGLIQWYLPAAHQTLSRWAASHANAAIATHPNGQQTLGTETGNGHVAFRRTSPYFLLGARVWAARWSSAGTLTAQVSPDGVVWSSEVDFLPSDEKAGYSVVADLSAVAGRWRDYFVRVNFTNGAAVTGFGLESTVQVASHAALAFRATELRYKDASPAGTPRFVVGVMSARSPAIRVEAIRAFRNQAPPSVEPIYVERPDVLVAPGISPSPLDTRHEYLLALTAPRIVRKIGVDFHELSGSPLDVEWRVSSRRSDQDPWELQAAGIGSIDGRLEVETLIDSPEIRVVVDASRPTRLRHLSAFADPSGG